MTIKEAELRTGLARANIRYYEDQGFFTAARGENGYRDYSEENIDTLLKVKLLRQLGFSLEEIHALQRGEQALPSALERREAGLERESRELARAAQLCRDMRAEGTDFQTLDARRYLGRLEREEEVLSKDRDPVRVFSWRRYFARTLDIQLYTTLLAVLLQLTCRLNLLRLEESGGRFLLTLGGLALMLGAETVMLHLWGTTPGKALLGLKLLREDGSFLSWEESARRTGKVTAFFGLSLLLAEIPLLICPLAGLGMLIWACWQVDRQRPLFWEEDQLYLEGSTKERPFWDNRRNYFRVAGWLAASAACIGLMVGGHFLAARPLHPGDNLTAEEFVENYNQYRAFAYGEENLTQRLALDGSFEDIPREGSSVVVIPITGFDGIPDPFFRFEQGADGLERVTLIHSFQTPDALGERDSYLVSVPYEKIYAAMRALLYGRLGDRKISALYQELVEAKGTFFSSQEGVEIESRLSFTGFYLFSDDMLLAEKGQAQSYHLEFTMSLT